MIEKLKYYLKNPKLVYRFLGKRKLLNWISDEKYISMIYEASMGKKLNLTKPQLFNEKLQWLKLNDHKDIYTTMVDKYAAKEYVAKKTSADIIIPTYGVWEDAKDIDFDMLPDKFVLKCTHDSGGMVVCTNKENMNKKLVIKKLNKCLKRNGYWYSREWPYKNVPARIIAEEYIGSDLQDYRIYCFNGVPKLIYTYTNESMADGSKPEPSHCDIFTCDWEPVPFHQKSKPKGNIEKPDRLDEMLGYARVLSENIPFLRVDFYDNGKVLFGELTFYPGAGLAPFYPEEWNEKLGSWIEL